MLEDVYLICPECNETSRYDFVEWLGQAEIYSDGEIAEIYHEWSFTPDHPDRMNRMHCEALCPRCRDVFKVDLVLGMEQYSTFKRHIHRVDFFTDEAEEELRRQNGTVVRRFSLAQPTVNRFSLPQRTGFCLRNRKVKG